MLATLLFSVTVIAMPLLLDHDIDFITAMITSIRTVAENPRAMLPFGFAIACMTVAALVPAFLGLLIVLPLAGHATWHLYRRAIAPV
ncbi:hypothetical protein D3C87_1879320 [compost metagenome]